MAINKWMSIVPKSIPDPPVISHFAQLVWRDTMRVGMGIAVYDEMGDSGELETTVVVVAHFNPPGNTLDSESFRENVILG